MAEPASGSRIVAKFVDRGRRELAAHRPGTAMQALQAALALAPEDPDALSLMASAAEQLGNRGAALDCLERLSAIDPKDPELQVSLGVALQQAGRGGDAIQHLRRASELAPTAAPVWFDLGEALLAEGDADAAGAAYARALAIDNTYIPARLGLARRAAAAGEIDVAIAGFRSVLKGDRCNPVAWFGLSYLNTVRFDATDRAALERTFARRDVPERLHNLAGFALAKALEDCGDYAGAFDLFARVNRAQRRHVQWNAEAGHRRVDAIIRTFRSTVAASARSERGRELIQLVSLPRSGASLVEQILASHPEVAGANEIRAMPGVIDAESRRRGRDFPAWVSSADAATWERLGDAYLARTARWRAGKLRFTDKNLANGYLVGATLAMLPAARAVIVRRDPLETCLACYRQCFSGYAGFAYDLDEMADYCIDFTRLTDFWLARYPGCVCLVQYETLVREPEREIRRLLDFCGLVFDPACLAFHRNARVVQSAPSAAQVRQPLRADTARAARYGASLDPLRERLRGAGLVA